MEQSVYYKNGKMRTEGERKDPSTGKTSKFATIIDGNNMYSFDPSTKKGMKMKFKEGASDEAGDLAYSKCRKAASKSGSAKINGVNCDIYKYTCNLSGSDVSVTEWRSKKDGFIMKSESLSGGYKTAVEVTEVKAGASVPDSMFATKGLELVDMDNMMGGAMMKQGASKKPAASSDDDDEDVQKAMEMFKGMFGQ